MFEKTDLKLLAVQVAECKQAMQVIVCKAGKPQQQLLQASCSTVPGRGIISCTSQDENALQQATEATAANAFHLHAQRRRVRCSKHMNNYKKPSLLDLQLAAPPALCLSAQLDP